MSLLSDDNYMYNSLNLLYRLMGANSIFPTEKEGLIKVDQRRNVKPCDIAIIFRFRKAQ